MVRCAGAFCQYTAEGVVTFKGKSYAAGHVLSVTLDPYQVAQVQSTANLSGSKVTASSPRLSSPATAVPRKTQLQPCGRAAATHICLGHPPRGAPLCPSTASTMWSTSWPARPQADLPPGGTHRSRRLQAGKVAKFGDPAVPATLPVCRRGIQVLMFGAGTTKDGETYDPHLVLIPDVAAYCPAYVGGERARL